MDVVIAHRSSKVHYMADWLSRCMYEEDVTVLQQLYGELAGDVSKVVRQVDIKK